MGFIYGNTISVTDYNILRTSAGWRAIPPKQAQVGIKNSVFLVSVTNEDNKTVGMARVITDGGCVAFILDVVVLPEYQGIGIGKTMLQMIMTYLQNKLEQGDILYVGLMAAKGKEDFYKKFGFEERPNEYHGAGMNQWIGKRNEELI